MAIALALPACAANHDGRLEARVSQLEHEVAALRASGLTPGCTDTRSRAYADNAQLTNTVPFMVSQSDVRPGDEITIQEVRGDRPIFDVSGAYVVRGTYKLASAEEATLAFTEQTIRMGQCSTASGHDKAVVKRGTGAFELATALPFEGYPHVSFFVNGQGAGGVVFGRTPTMAQRANRAAAKITR